MIRLEYQRPDHGATWHLIEQGMNPRLGLQNYNARECEETNERRALRVSHHFFSLSVGSLKDVTVRMSVGGVALPGLKCGSLFFLRTEGRRTVGEPRKGKSNRVSCGVARKVQDNS